MRRAPALTSKITVYSWNTRWGEKHGDHSDRCRGIVGWAFIIIAAAPVLLIPL